MTIRYLIDENLPPALRDGLLRRNEQIDVLRVGDPSAPAFGTKDAPLLLWCEYERTILVTDDRKTMSGHVANHYALGHMHWGIFRVRPGTLVWAFGDILDTLHLVWVTSEVQEWQHAMEWIPFS